MASREERRLVVIDIAVPRDVEATAKLLPGVTLYDIDDLDQAAEENLNGRRREAERAELIILDELSHFRRWHRGVATAPGVRALWARAEAIRQSELAEIDSNSLSPEARVQLDAVTRSLVKKLFHEPTQRLRALDDRDAGLRHLESLRYLFGLAEPEAEGRVEEAARKPAHAGPHVHAQVS
jgi:glutamyl-tRNA reductase